VTYHCSTSLVNSILADFTAVGIRLITSHTNSVTGNFSAFRICCLSVSRDSFLSIATCYWLDGPEFELRSCRYFPNSSRPFLEPTPASRDKGSLSRG